MQQLASRINSAEALSFEASVSGQAIKYLNNNIENATVMMVSHDFDKIKSFELSAGRYFSESESNSGRPVAILGSSVASGLYGDYNQSIGKDVNVLGRKLEVIGVFKEEGKSLMESEMDNNVVIPLNFGRNIINIRSDRIDPYIKVKIKDGISMQYASDEVKSIMRSLRRLRPIEEDNFAINQPSLLSNNITSLFSTLDIAGMIIGGFSILVGGFSIANIMFVSVRERTHQIGIQKSLGAKNYFILMQFLSEAIVLCVIGGLVGLLIIYILTLIISYAADFTLVLTMKNISLGIIISAAIGLISGFIPAYSASQLDPVEAIRANG